MTGLDWLACRPGVRAPRLCPSGVCLTCDRLRLTLGAVDVPERGERGGADDAVADGPSEGQATLAEVAGS